MTSKTGQSKRRQKMVCPECGVEMNRHANRIIEPRTSEEAAHADPALGGMVVQVHCCPECGESTGQRLSRP